MTSKNKKAPELREQRPGRRQGKTCKNSSTTLPESQMRMAEKLRRCFIETVDDANDLLETGLVKLCPDAKQFSEQFPRWSLTADGILLMVQAGYGDWLTQWYRAWKRRN